MNISVQITRQENAEALGCAVGDTAAVDFEEYVAAVTASEIGNSAPEACKAQAIAARTFAVNRGVLRGKAISDSSATAQAYRAKRYDYRAYPNALTGARETAGEILTYGGKAISAVYSASNGGRTVSSRERWGNVCSYLIEQDDPWDRAFGQPKCGHGVGMSQDGAKWASENGIGHTEILAFYYPGTEIVKAYGEGEKKTETNEKARAVITLAESKLGDPYVYGASGQKCTPEVRKRYAGYHPEYRAKIYGACPVLSGKQSTCSGCKWEGHLCYDCRGFTYYTLKTAAGIVLQGGGATSQYSTQGNWDARGRIEDMPDLVCCVFKQNGSRMSHTGLHVGGGKIIHCSTVVKEGSLQDTPKWKYFGLPKGLYTAEEIRKAGVVKMAETLRTGSMGEAVRKLQFDLYKLGYTNLEINGVYDTDTELAVRLFQQAKGLTVDGICGPKTWAAVNAGLESLGQADGTEESEPDKLYEDACGYVPDDGVPTMAGGTVTVTIPAGTTIAFSATAAMNIYQQLQEAMGGK